MKNDHSFKLVLAVITAGIFLALFTPARAAEKPVAQVDSQQLFLP